MAQLEVCPTGDQGVAASIPAGSGNILLWNDIPLLLIQEEQLSVSGKRMCTSILGPVVQSIVSLTSSLRVISLTVLADSIHNILIFFAEKM